jgi:hypothetical protein
LYNKKDQIIKLNNVLEKAIDYSIDFPFLTDEKTINFIKNSKLTSIPVAMNHQSPFSPI